MEKIKITSDYIQLDQFLKYVNLVGSGGEAKILISEGRVKVNDAVEMRRGKKLRTNDIVSIDDEISYSIE
ncbi:RNA-binding S4 domain-containing protein [Proteinivorax hydrogeniformans]|uniref:RNA-binding S4 domain-containing protein n=1 Tax=Proteinivorax hydrogeniformans TaxID=1826727 RepID=A0AAU8HU01_9FIRM